jgi:hypothetical protein
MTQASDLQIKSRDGDGRPNRAGEARAVDSSAPLLAGALRNDFCMRYFACVGAALLCACLVPACAMAALRSPAEIASSAFVITFGMASGHAVLLGLPLFLIFRSTDRVNATTCVVVGFAIGSAPVAVLSWPTQHRQSTAALSTMTDAAVLIAGWVNYLTPPMHFGVFGALGGAVFWLVLSGFDAVAKSAVHVRFLQSRRVSA